MPLLRADSSELWVLHEWVRQNRGAPEYGQEHEREFVEKLWRAILELDLPDNKGKSLDIDFTTGQLLQITRQLSMGITMGNRFIGQELIKKAFTALVKEADYGTLPAIYIGALTSADADYLTGSGTDAPAQSG